MQRLLPFLSTFICSLTLASSLSSQVDTRIGTDYSPTALQGAASERAGNTQPTGAVPFGMVQWGPDTNRGAEGSYHYQDPEISGFSLTHISGAGCKSPRLLSVLPLNGSAGSKGEKFDHPAEEAHAGYYRVKLSNGIEVELSGTLRTGAARFTYLDSATPGIQLKNFGSFRALDSRQLRGSVDGGNFCGTHNHYRIYYFVEFDQAILHSERKHDTVRFFFTNGAHHQIQMKVGLSFVSENGAQANLRSENANADFSEIKSWAENSWNGRLQTIQVSGGSSTENKIFYTALYHSLLHPNVFSDSDGSYIGFDQKIHHVSENPGQHDQYANFSGWDIYRSEIQLLAILFPTLSGDIIQSLVNDGSQCGALPKWAYNNDDTGVMVGDPGPLIVANAHAFGVNAFDAQEALSLMKQSGEVPGLRCNGHEIRPGLKEYQELGFVPLKGKFFDFNDQSVSTTIEYSTADFAISKFAQSLNDLPSSTHFLYQSNAWKNLFDPETKLLRPKYRNTKWMRFFRPESTQGFTEGNSVQYTWTIPFDFQTVVEKMGGPDIAKKRLVSFFSKVNDWKHEPYAWIGNEPSFSIPWMFDALGAPELTESVISKIMSETFSDQPSGLPGNDDLGATSSWYVWAALGMYPITPGVAELAMSRSHFPQIDLTLENGNHVLIENDAGETPIRTMRVNGDEWKRSNWLPWEKLKSGGSIHFE